MINERRTFVRKEAILRVMYKSETQLQTKEVFTINVSGKGLCVETSERLEKNSKLELAIFLPDIETPLAAIAKVKWQKKSFKRSKEGKFCFITGLEIMRMTLEERRKLIDLVHRILSKK